MYIGREFLDPKESARIFECKCFSEARTSNCYAKRIYTYDPITGKKDQDDEKAYQLYNISRDDINKNNVGRFTYDAIPAYSIFDLISILPEEISIIQNNKVLKFKAYVDILNGYFKYYNETVDLCVESNDDIIDSLYNAAIWYNDNIYNSMLSMACRFADTVKPYNEMYKYDDLIDSFMAGFRTGSSIVSDIIYSNNKIESFLFMFINSLYAISKMDKYKDMNINIYKTARVYSLSYFIVSVHIKSEMVLSVRLNNTYWNFIGSEDNALIKYESMLESSVTDNLDIYNIISKVLKAITNDK